MKLTPWFQSHALPIRKGVYERKDSYGDIAGFSYWNGHEWYLSSSHPDIALLWHEMGHVSLHQGWQWRGLAEAPSSD